MSLTDLGCSFFFESILCKQNSKNNRIDKELIDEEEKEMENDEFSDEHK